MITMTIIGVSLITIYKLQEKGKISVNDLIIKIILVGISLFFGWELLIGIISETMNLLQ